MEYQGSEVSRLKDLHGRQMRLGLRQRQRAEVGPLNRVLNQLQDQDLQYVVF